MQAALQQVAGQFGRTYPLVIDGQHGRDRRRRSIRSTRRTCGRSSAGAAGRRRRRPTRPIAAAARGVPGLARHRAGAAGRVPVPARPTVMRRRRFELAAWEVYECGKPWREADADVAEAIDLLRLSTAARCCGWPGRSARDVPGEENVYFYEPRGVAVVIAPWNFPLAILCGMTTAALVTGNTVVMKPAEQSSVIGAKLMEVFQEVGLPPGVVNYLPGVGEEIGPTLVEHPRRGHDRLHRLARRRPAASTARPPRRRRARTTSSASSPRWAARTPSSSTTTPTWTRRCTASSHSAFGYAGQKCSACSPGDRAGAASRRVPGPADRGDAQPEDRPGRGPRLHASARSSTRRRSERILELHREGQDGRPAGLRRRRRALWPTKATYVGAAHLRRRAADGSHRPGGDLRPGAGGHQGRATSTHALEIANGTPYALTGGLYSRSPAEHRAGASASSASAICTSIARSPGPWWTGSRSAASSCRASAPRRAGRITCCSSCCRGLSRRTRCAAASPPTVDADA